MEQLVPVAVRRDYILVIIGARIRFSDASSVESSSRRWINAGACGKSQQADSDKGEEWSQIGMCIHTYRSCHLFEYYQLDATNNEDL
jgi:hypothetical protein